MPTWQELKRQQEEQLSNAIRALFGMDDKIPVTSSITDDGCMVTLHTSSLSKFEFSWSNKEPQDLTISTTSGRITTEPYGIQLTPATITLSAISAVRGVITSMLMPQDEAPVDVEITERTEGNDEESDVETTDAANENN